MLEVSVTDPDNPDYSGIPDRHDRGAWSNDDVE
jgi:hypothetical protein